MVTFLKHAAVVFAGTAVSAAIIFRVPFLRKLVTNSAS